MEQTFFNKELFTHILSFLDNRQHKNIIHSFKHMIYFDNIRTTHHMLLYGQVQSGKTSKIIDFISYNKHKLNILIIQNNRNMLSQYTQSLTNRHISYIIINSLTVHDRYNQQNLIIIINNI